MATQLLSNSDEHMKRTKVYPEYTSKLLRTSKEREKNLI